MWKGRIFILWNHIADIFYEDRECVTTQKMKFSIKDFFIFCAVCGLHLHLKITCKHTLSQYLIQL